MRELRAKNRSRRGVILLVTLVIVSLLALVIVSLQFRSLAEQKASSVTMDGEQARGAAMSGIQRAINILRSSPSDPALWKDNPDELRSQLVFEDGARSWYFTVYAASDEEGEQVRYGAVDESGKFNINVVTEDQMLSFEGVDRDLVDCLLDWRDKDDDVRDYGAEREYYESLQPIGYAPRNGFLVSVEELLLARGFSGGVVYGEDANFNGILDPNEDDTNESFPMDDGDGILDTGLMGIATAVSWEPNIDSRGEDRVNINGDVDELKNSLEDVRISDDTVRFILLYREDGGRFLSPLQLLDMEHVLQKDHKEYPGARKGTKIESGVDEQDLGRVLDYLSVRPPGLRGFSVGQVNVCTAPERVLAALPGLDEDTARRIVTARVSLDSSDRRTPAWLLTEGILDKEEFEKVYPFVTSRGFQYRIRCVGFSYPAGCFCVLEAIVDLARPSGGVFYIRDLTKFGVPVPLDPESFER